MIHAVMIPVADHPLPPWKLEGVRFERAENEQAGVDALSSWPCDAALLVTGPDLTRAIQLAAALEADFKADLPPVLLVIDSRHVQSAIPLARVNADAVIDLAWPEHLSRGCLELVIGRVRTGRGLVGIQDELFRALSGEVHSLRNLSIRDELTGLFNLRHFREVVSREHLRCRRHDRKYALVLSDVDKLREINNTFGHAVGTRALLEFARAISSCTRDSDCSFRIGGDEFVTLLVEADTAAGNAYAERVTKALRAHSLIEDGVTIDLSMSAGIASYPGGGDTPEQILKNADSALYSSKALGRNRISVNAERASGIK